MPRSTTSNYSIGQDATSGVSKKYDNGRWGSASSRNSGSRNSPPSGRQNSGRQTSRQDLDDDMTRNRENSASYMNRNRENSRGVSNNRFENNATNKSEFANTFKVVGGGGSKMFGMRSFGDNSKILNKMSRYADNDGSDNSRYMSTPRQNKTTVTHGVQSNERYNNNTTYTNTSNKQYSQAHVTNNTDRFSNNPKINNVLSMDKVVKTNGNSRYGGNKNDKLTPMGTSNKRYGGLVRGNNSKPTHATKKQYREPTRTVRTNRDSSLQNRRQVDKNISRMPVTATKANDGPEGATGFPKIMRETGANAASRYNVVKNTWYKLRIDLHDGENEYRNGLLKIYGDLERTQIFPTIKLPNIIFTSKSKIESIEDLDKLTSFNVYFKSVDTAYVNIQMVNVNMRHMKIEQAYEEDVRKNVNLWKLRKLYDLDFINYYLEKLFKEFDNQTFMDKFYGDYKLFSNITYFDTFIGKLKSKLRLKPNTKYNESQKTTVLYLTHSGIEYEQTPETLRTHKLAEVITNEEYNTIVGYKYGYPYEKPADYYRSGVENKIIGDVRYVKLLNNDDNYNTNSLVEYLEKYITETIKMAHGIDAKVIHATTNFWNGIAAIYAAKFLGIKSVYEVRNFWDEIRPEIHDSDIVNLRDNLENLVMTNTDSIIAINSSVKLQIIDRGIDSEKIYVIPDGVDVDNQELTDQEREKLTTSLKLDNYCGILGYLGATYKEEGLKTLIDAVGLLSAEHDKQFKLIITGYGDNDLTSYIKKAGLEQNIIVIKLTDDNQSIRYCDLIDTFVFPRNGEMEIDGNLDNLFRVMSMEKSVIISDIYETNGIMKDEDRCLIFEHDDVSDLADKILRLYEDKEFAEEMGSKCKEFVTKFVDWKVFGNKVRNIYEDILYTSEE